MIYVLIFFVQLDNFFTFEIKKKIIYNIYQIVQKIQRYIQVMSNYLMKFLKKMI